MKRESRRSERGIALMLCLFALLLLTSIAMGLMFMSKTETTVNYNYRASTQAYYAARAGLEEGRERLRFGTASYIAPPTAIPSTSQPNGIVYITNTPDTANDVVEPWNTSNRYFDDLLCNEPFYNSTSNSLGLTPNYGVPCTQGAPASSYTGYISSDQGYGTKAAMGYKWIRITLKQNCTEFYGVDGTYGNGCTSGSNRAVQVCADPDDLAPDMVNGAPREKLLVSGGANCESASPIPLRPVYVITSMASSIRGPRRMTQMEVASVKLPPLPAAVTLDGANPAVSLPGSGTVNKINGFDHSSAGCLTVPAKPAIGVLGSSSFTLPVPGNYSGASPSVQDVTNYMSSRFKRVDNLQDIVSKIAAAADQTYGNNPSIANLGTDTNPLITYVNGDFTMGTTHGAGLLLVTGTLTVSGNPNFNGVILVIGKGAVQMGGTGAGSFNGGIFVANLVDATLNTPAAPSFSWSGGSDSFDINYDSCWIRRMAGRLGYSVIAEREKMY